MGKRVINPLSKFASYTYHLTLYMVTPAAYISFISSGSEKMPNLGCYVVAESGGTAASKVKRMFPDREYFIDDLTFKTFSNAKVTDGPINTISFEFKIYEPFGFSFTSQLRAAASSIAKDSGIPNFEKNQNPLRNFFVLGFKFFGYNDKGEYQTYDDRNADIGETFGNSPSNTATGVFPRYFSVNITDFSFKLDGKTTVYNLKMSPVSIQEGFGIKHAQIQTNFEIVGGTVGDILGSTPPTNGAKSIVDCLNKNEQDKKRDKLTTRENVYKIVIDPEIAKAKLVISELLSKTKTSSATGAINSATVSDKISTSELIYDTENRTFTASSGMSIVKLIDNVICQSTYVQDALTVIYNESNELEAKENPNNGKQLKWFVINPTVIPLEYVEQINDFAYEITYTVTTYKIPFVKSTFLDRNNKTPYYGPHKKYNYLFTGQNTEILNFETTYNSLYFIPGGMSKNDKIDSTGSMGTPIAPGTKIAGSESLIGKAGAPVGSITTSIYSPGDTVKAKIQILGDPDYLMTRIGGGQSPRSPKELAHGADYTINPYGGQVFIEILFNEGVDYNMYTGLFNINSNVEFYAGPLSEASQRTKGMIYMVLSVTSTFSKGKFMQELDLVMWTDVTTPEASSLNGRESAKNEVAKSEVMRNLFKTNYEKNPIGLGLPPPITENANQLAAVEFGNAPAQTLAQTNRSILTSQGVPVADDDAASTPIYASISDDEKNGRTI
ncbi:MAG: hypothetical protein ACOVLB_04735 [Candidatus Nanopelagicus sp.]